ncbi:uncharacterized protein LOC130693177 [Daphnia carinata]|uniref:uncharacterized protein LOC130693177 n=1 Tax=Daphnia carinata TaxID=120202 RepID=UPI002580E6AA|nr:uncharacterized protein LOC130693177 [Daphnia carinata]
MSSASQGKERQKPCTFPYKLWQLMNECTDGAIRWSANGDSVIIDQKSFCSSIFVGKIFKSIQWPSFVRQLNLYGFRKISPHGHHQGPCKCPCHVSTCNCYMHEHFRRWTFDSLSLVTRPRKQSKAGSTSICDMQNKNDINGNKSQSLSNQTDCFDLNGSQELLNWNEATVPIGILKEPISNSELSESTADQMLHDQNNSVSLENTSIKNEHSLKIVPPEHCRVYHIESSLDSHAWTEMTSKNDQDPNLTQAICAETDDQFPFFYQFDGTERVIVFPETIPDVLEVEIFDNGGTELMDIDVEAGGCESTNGISVCSHD